MKFLKTAASISSLNPNRELKSFEKLCCLFGRGSRLRNHNKVRFTKMGASHPSSQRAALRPCTLGFRPCKEPRGCPRLRSEHADASWKRYIFNRFWHPQTMPGPQVVTLCDRVISSRSSTTLCRRSLLAKAPLSDADNRIAVRYFRHGFFCQSCTA